MEPCGTSNNTGVQFDECPFMTTRCLLVVRKDENHLVIPKLSVSKVHVDEAWNRIEYFCKIKESTMGMKVVCELIN